MRLIKEFQDRAARFHETKRLVERAKGLLNPHKIALVGEFRESVLGPLLADNRSSFARLHQRKSADCRDLLKLWIATEGIPTFPVSAGLLPETCPDYTYANLFGADAREIERLSQKMVDKGQVESAYVAEALKTHAMWARRTETYPAVHLGQMLIAMDWALEPELETREWTALLRGEGQTVTRFWDTVNGLRDFSRHFPDRPPTQGKKREPRKPVVAVNPNFGWAGPATI